MAYIWINPVTARMYETEELNKFLSRFGYQRYENVTDWSAIVKEKYRQAVQNSSHIVVDMRCPKIKTLLEDLQMEHKVSFPDIEPILIHCGVEVSTERKLLEEEKLITTPCQALADLGNSLNLKNTRFISWRNFLDLIGEEPVGILPTKSPIPPGFFDIPEVKTISITGEEEIRNYLKNGVPDDVQLIEMLYCKDGCHNGDGIRMCEV